MGEAFERNRITEVKSSKHQHPSTREIPNTKLQLARAGLELGSWWFSGAWILVLGASLDVGAFIKFLFIMLRSQMIPATQ
jgi:hypothetical protein